MTELLTPVEVAAFLSVRDPRTVRRRLVELGVPVVPFGRSYRVRDVDLDRAVAGAVVVTVRRERPSDIGVRLAPGARLWDAPPDNQAGPRRV